MKHVLFICSQNRLRSPTAEQVFATYPGIAVSSAGLNNDADNPLTAEFVTWADIIFVMEPSHRTKLARKFKASLNGQRVICLGIRDVYDFMEPVLIQLLQAKVSPYLPHVH